jgi:hypothetical protein
VWTPIGPRKAAHWRASGQKRRRPSPAGPAAQTPASATAATRLLGMCAVAQAATPVAQLFKDETDTVRVVRVFQSSLGRSMLLPGAPCLRTACKGTKHPKSTGPLMQRTRLPTSPTSLPCVLPLHQPGPAATEALAVLLHDAGGTVRRGRRKRRWAACLCHRSGCTSRDLAQKLECHSPPAMYGSVQAARRQRQPAPARAPCRAPHKGVPTPPESRRPPGPAAFKPSPAPRVNGVNLVKPSIPSITPFSPSSPSPPKHDRPDRAPTLLC